jgi:hypothetical protein
MTLTIRCLHTATIHAATFDNLFHAAAPDVTLVHHVRADWLAQARQSGLGTQLWAAVRHQLETDAATADAVLSTCSTLGPVADAVARHYPNVVRGDRPMMDAAAAHAGAVLLAYCLDSTRDASVQLLTAALQSAGRSAASYQTVSCRDAWPAFERQDAEAFATSIALCITKAAKTIPDLGSIVLAQPSMALAEPRLSHLRVPVLSSPRLATLETLRVAARQKIGST